MPGFPNSTGEELRGEPDHLVVTDNFAIPRRELVSRATRSGGPGGQHVNTSSSRIELLWNLLSSSVPSADEIERLAARLGKRVDSEGWLRVVCSESRSQLRNRRLAEQRLVELLRRALYVPRKRKATKPTASSRAARLRSKKLRSLKKKNRGPLRED
jgi:ribosome-associated protein